MNRCKGKIDPHANTTYPWTEPVTKDTGRKERDSLTMEFHFGIEAQHTTETREHTHDEKECPRFSEKEGGGHGEKRLKDMF